MQIIDGKVRLVSDLLCDGLGACIGQCPVGAISIERREAEPYDEAKVIADLAGKGRNTIVAHLRHLKDHGQAQFLAQAIAALRARPGGLGSDLDQVLAALEAPPQSQRKGTLASVARGAGGCPGARTLTFDKPAVKPSDGPAVASALRQWPIQLHLVNPLAPYFQGAELLVAADCVAFAVGDFHTRHLAGKSLVIACPKLDSHMEIYVEKIRQMVDSAGVKSITVMVMEVPCCGGLFQMVRQAVSQAARPVPVTLTVVGLQGEILSAQTVA